MPTPTTFKFIKSEIHVSGKSKKKHEVQKLLTLHLRHEYCPNLLQEPPEK